LIEKDFQQKIVYAIFLKTNLIKTILIFVNLLAPQE